MVVLLVHRSIFFIVLYNVLSSLFLFSHEFFTNLFIILFYLVSERATLRSVQLRFTMYMCVL